MSRQTQFTSTSIEKCKGIICSIVCPVIFCAYQVKISLISKGIIKEDSRFSKIKLYKNRHKGQRVFIVATGPSLIQEDLDKLKGECTISMNSIVNNFTKNTFRPTYYMCSDKQVYDRIPHAQTMMEPTKVFIGIGNIKTKWNIDIKDVCNPEDYDVNLFRVDRTQTLKYIYYNKDNFKTNFSFDAEKGIIDGGSITYCAIQFAVYMGFKEIYLLGVDCNYLSSKAHFGEEERLISLENKMNAIYAAYQQKRAYECALESTRDTDVKIYNATRGGKLEVFPRVDFDSLFL